MAHKSSKQFANTMTSLCLFILTNSHRHIQYVEIVTLKESTLNSALPQGLSSISVNEIIVKPHDLWYKQLHEYLKWNETPPYLSTSEKWTFKQKDSCYTIIGDVIYKRSYDRFLLRCLELYDQVISIQNYHDDICGGYFNGIAISKHIIRMGYYWPTKEW